MLAISLRQLELHINVQFFTISIIALFQWMILLGSISVLIPVLAPIIFIVMVILFLIRIGFVKNNWKPFYRGSVSTDIWDY